MSFSTPGSDPGAHAALCCCVSWVSSNLCLLLIISLSSVTLTFLKNNFMYLVECLKILVCVSFSWGWIKVVEFEEEFHRGKVPALYYIESPSHSPDLSLVMLYLIPWLSGTDQVFFHCGDTFYLLWANIVGETLLVSVCISSLIVGTCFPLDSG